jgi:hypothetical protein
MHRRPFKGFYEEIFPLSVFVNQCYGTREDVRVTPNLDNRSFDATIHDLSVSPPTELLVEITVARDPQEHIRMEHFVRHRNVSLWSPVNATGTKQNRRITIKPEAVEHKELVARYCSWIKKAAEGKADKTSRYGDSHVLVIAYDDWPKPTAADLATLTTFMREHVLTLPLSFSKVYLVGLFGRVYLPFQLT